MDKKQTPALPNDIATTARAWIDAAESRWRLQILARRSRAGKTGVKLVPSRLRRFVEGLPWAYVKPAVDYLLSKAPYRGIIANGVDFHAAYRPTLTVWQRDSRETATGAKGASVGDATYTLVQDLIEADSRDTYAVGTSSSCSETVVSEYVWDAAEIEELPQGSMGVTYQIANVRRNDDGTFDYALVKRVALTQHSGPTVSEDNRVRTVSVETWDNVYVDSDGRYCDDAWAPIAGAVAGISKDAQGRAVETKVSVAGENPDCTLRLTVTAETSKPADIRRLTSENQYQELVEEESSGQPEPLPDAPDAKDGVVVRREHKLQPDGSYDNVERVEAEQTVNRSVVTQRFGRTGGVRTVKNVATTGSVPPAEDMPKFSVSRIGQSVEYEKTPGRRVTVTTTTPVRPAKDTPVAYTCESTATLHTVREETTLPKVPDMTSESAAKVHTKPGGGVHTTTSVRVGDSGECVKETATVTEVNEEVERTLERTPRATIVTTIMSSEPGTKQIPEPKEANRKLSVGEMQHQSLTEGGNWRITKRTIDRSAAKGDRAYCSKTAFLHQHDVPKIEESDFDFSDMDDVSDAGGGVYYHKEASIDQHGVVQTVTRTYREVPVPDYSTVKEGDWFHSVTTTGSRNAIGTLGFWSEGSQVASDSGTLTSCRYERTDGGSYSGSVSTDVPSERTWEDEITTELYCAKTWFFRNAYAGTYQALRGEAQQYADNFKSGTWVGSTNPTSLRISGSPVMNGYGRYDGHYTVEASWDPVTGGRNNNRDTNETHLADWAYTVISNSYNIGYSGGASSDEFVTAVHRTKTAKTVHETITSGWRTYVAGGFSGDVIEGSHVTVTPSTGIAHGVKVEKASTTITIEKIQGKQTNWEANWATS